MKAIITYLSVGMIGIVIFGGSGGLIQNFITGTSTADTAFKALWLVAFALAILVLILFKAIGRRRQQ